MKALPGMGAIMGLFIVTLGCASVSRYYLRDPETGLVYGPVIAIEGDQPIHPRHYELVAESKWARNASALRERIAKVHVDQLNITGDTVAEALNKIDALIPRDEGKPLLHLQFDSAALNKYCPARFLYLEFNDISLLALLEAIPGFSPVRLKFVGNTMFFSADKGIEGRDPGKVQR